MTAEDNTTTEPSKASAGSPSSGSNNSSAANSTKTVNLPSSEPSATVVTEDDRYRSYTSISEGSQDSGTNLLPEVTFGPVFENLATLMSSPSRNGNRENQPLLGHQRSLEIEEFNLWTDDPQFTDLVKQAELALKMLFIQKEYTKVQVAVTLLKITLVKLLLFTNLKTKSLMVALTPSGQNGYTKFAVHAALVGLALSLIKDIYQSQELP